MRNSGPAFVADSPRHATVELKLDPQAVDVAELGGVLSRRHYVSDHTVTVRFATTDNGEVTDRIVEVTVANPDGLTPLSLRDFPWARWLRAATAHARMFFVFTLDHRDQAIAVAREINDTADLPEPGARPGKAGHGDEHWQWVANRYRTLTESGSHKPVAIIAEERGVSANTAAGWVRRTRELGLLPPARHGKAG